MVMVMVMCVQGLEELTAEQQEEVHRVCSLIPDVDVQVDIFVEDEGEIAENDLVTIKVRSTARSHDYLGLVLDSLGQGNVMYKMVWMPGMLRTNILQLCFAVEPCVALPEILGSLVMPWLTR